MKKKVFLVSILCIFLVTFIYSYTFGQEKKILIRYTHQHPTNFSFHKGAEKFTKVVEERSKGQVKFEMYPASQLYKASETVKAVTSGAVEMGHCVIDEWGLVFPLADIFMKPFLANTKEARMEVTKGKIGEMVEKEMTKAGAKTMFFMPHDNMAWVGNNKWPLRVPKDFEKTLIRTTPGMVTILEALGAKGVRMNVDEVYMAMQRGTVDGCLSAPSSATNRKWQEVSKYSTIIDMVAIYNVAFINTAFWRKLPADIQKIMIEANHEAEKFVESIAQKEEEEAIEILKGKTQVYFPTPQEASLWENATRPVIENYIKKGGPRVKEAVEEINRLKMRAKKS